MNKIIYVDSLASTDNIWLLDIANMKAWSMTETDVDIISDFLFWNFSFTDDLLNNFGWTDYYDIALNSGWNSFLPPTYWNFTQSSLSSTQWSNWNKSYKGANIWLSYNKNYDFVWPSFWVWEWWGWTWQVAITYQQCVDTYTPIDTMSKYINACSKSSQFEDLIYYVINYSSGDTYTWSFESVSCRNMVNYADDLYNLSVSSGAYHHKVELAIEYSDLWWVPFDTVCWKYLSDSENWEISSFISNIQASFNSGYNYFNVPKCVDDYYWKSYAWWNYLLLFVVGRILFIFLSAF